jgi:hypothetical protein
MKRIGVKNLTRFFAIAAIGITSLSAAEKPVKVYILAGDEAMLRQGAIDGVARGPGKKKSDSAEPLDKPGTLLKVIQDNPRYSFLRRPPAFQQHPRAGAVTASAIRSC